MDRNSAEPVFEPLIFRWTFHPTGERFRNQGYRAAAFASSCVRCLPSSSGSYSSSHWLGLRWNATIGHFRQGATFLPVPASYSLTGRLITLETSHSPPNPTHTPPSSCSPLLMKSHSAVFHPSSHLASHFPIFPSSLSLFHRCFAFGTVLVPENSHALIVTVVSSIPPTGHIDSRGIQLQRDGWWIPNDLSLDRRKQRWGSKRLSFIQQLPAIICEKVRKLIQSLPSLSAQRDGGLLAIHSELTPKTAKRIRCARNLRALNSSPISAGKSLVT